MTGQLPPVGKLLALDVGLARIGLAVCDPLRLTVRPHSTWARADRRTDFAHLAQVITAEEIVAVVCGLPLNMDGSSGPQARTTHKWALRLAHALRTVLGHPLPVALWDERLSSVTARHTSDWPRGVGEDAVAAAVILQSLLDALRRGAAEMEVIHLPMREPEGGHSRVAVIEESDA